MDKDVAPKLIENVNKAFEKNCIKDGTMQAMTRKLEEGAASYSDAYRYAESVGNARAQAFKSEINSSVLPDGRMYYNIGNRLLNDSLRTDHDMVADYAAKVQEIYNKEAGISLKAQKADKDESRIKGFVDRLDSEEDYDKVSWILDEPVKVHAMSVVDDTIKKNAEFQGKAGVKATVIRDAKSDCCGWCTDLAGDYVYPQVPNEVFARHDNCRCSLEYEGRKLSAYNSGGKAHSFRDLGEQEKIEKRKERADELNRTFFGGKVRFMTGGMDPKEYARAVELWDKVQEIKVPNREHIVEEIDNWIAKLGERKCVVSHEVDNYRYYAVTKGHNEYKIYSMEPVTKGIDWLDDVLTEVIGKDWRKYDI